MNSKEYQDAKIILLQEKLEQTKNAMQSAIIRRQMLIDSKSKYAGVVYFTIIYFLCWVLE